MLLTTSSTIHKLLNRFNDTETILDGDKINLDLVLVYNSVPRSKQNKKQPTHKRKTIDIVFTRLDEAYGDKLNERQWKIFCVAETLGTMKVKPVVQNTISNLWNVFAIGISVFILNKVFVKY